MKTFVNPPIAHPELDLGSGGTYGLAHIALKSEVYRDRLKSQKASGRYVLLDNAADELQVGMNGNAFYDLIMDVKPDEVIAPDVLQDAEATLKNTKQFLEEFKVPRGMKVMAVAQGRNFTEFLDCYTTWLEDPRVDVVGIPYDIEFRSNPFSSSDTEGPSRDKALNSYRRGFRRVELVGELCEKELVAKPIHLLGMNNLWELSLYQKFGEDRGVIFRNDTTAPFAAAFNDVSWESVICPLLARGPSDKNWPALDFDSKIESDELWDMVRTNLLAYFSAASDHEAMRALWEVTR